MSMLETPRGERVHIAIFGRRNAGKSSLINALTGQKISIVSDVAGTTTDPVFKAMELLPIGPVVLIDTPGLDDVGTLGQLRVESAIRVLEKTDLAILVADSRSGVGSWERDIIEKIRERKIPMLVVYSKSDLIEGGAPALREAVLSVAKEWKIPAVPASGLTGEGIEQVREAWIRILPEEED